MQRTQWNDDEDAALRKVTWMARVVYLQGIRRKMDYESGVAGRTSVISYQALSEMLDCSEHTTQPDPRATKRMLQRSFESLERAGLVEWVKPSAGQQQRGIVFRCLLADAHHSDQIQAVPKRYPSGTQTAVPSETSNGAALQQEAVPSFAAPQHAQAVPPLVSGNQEEEEPPLPPKPKSATWTPPSWINASAWAEFEQHRRDIRKPLTDLARDKAANQLQGMSFAEQQSCIDRSIQSRWAGLFPEKTAKPYQSSKASRVAEANRAAGDEFVNGDRVIQGQFRRVQ